MKKAILAGILVLTCTIGPGCRSQPEGDREAGAPLRQPLPPAAPEAVEAPTDSTTAVEMRHVHFRLGSGLVLDIRRLQGTMKPTAGAGYIYFDDKSSFVIQIDRAEVGMSTASLTRLMNDYIFNYEGAPLKDLDLRIEGNRLIQTGKLDKDIDIPFEIRAEVSATPEGLIRIHPTDIKVLEVIGEGVMDALGLQLDEILDLSRAQGVKAEENDLLLDPEQILPAPAIRGRVTAVRLEGDEVVQVFGTDAAPASSAQESSTPEEPVPPQTSAENYMYYRGGLLRFGKLFMVDADLQIIDTDPQDPFDFYLDKYIDQLVAGYSRTSPDLSLTAYMPDFGDPAPVQHSRPSP